MLLLLHKVLGAIKLIKLGDRVWYLDEYGKPKQGIVCHIDLKSFEGRWYDADKQESEYDTIYTCRRDGRFFTTVEHTANKLFLDKNTCIAASIKALLDENRDL